MKRTASWAWVLVVLGLQACSASRPTVTLSENPDVNAFLTTIHHHLEAHDWPKLLEQADPDHYQTQVTDMGMGTVQYVAELFGLYMVDNSIQTGEALTWEDLDRIQSVQFQDLTGSAETLQVSGIVTLSNNETLNLNFEIIEKGGKHWLTGAVG